MPFITYLRCKLHLQNGPASPSGFSTQLRLPKMMSSTSEVDGVTVRLDRWLVSATS